VNRYVEIYALTLTICCVASAQELPCPALPPMLRTWDALYKSYSSYRHCDDGLIGENYSESVARILVDHWNTLPRFAFLTRQSSEFRRFVLKHIDASLDRDDLTGIRKKATTQCPKGLRVLCDEMSKQANTALKENAAPH
jgi:hypothetical protein